MIEHLSGEQISQWMIGERGPQLERHVAECGECRAQLADLETTLSRFRGAVREMSSSAPLPAWRQPASGPWFSWPRLAFAAATLLLVAVFPVYWSAHVKEEAAESARADALLLERVDSSISRAVPAPMEPLVNLVTWNSSPAEMKKKAERQ